MNCATLSALFGMATALPNPSYRLIHFGSFEVDLRSKELRKCGVKLRLQGQPLQVLLILLEHNNEVVTREELRSAVWPRNSFGDVDHALNKAVGHLREVLSDSPETPRFIETLPRIGYRFVGQVEWIAEKPAEPRRDVLPSGPHITQHWSTKKSARLWFAILVAIGLLLAGTWWKFQSRQPPIRSLAVLPFENLSSDPGQEYFVDGVTDELITKLAKNPALQVTSRTSVMHYKKDHPSLGEIAKELRVDAILEGSVSRNGNRVHVTAQLIHASTDTHLWAESYDRDLKDISYLQSELAQTIAKQVGLNASPDPKREKWINPAAHDAYLLGRYYWFGGPLEKSREYFQEAIDIQPDYAEAWSGLAHYYGSIGSRGTGPRSSIIAQVEAAARKSVELDDSLPEAHNAMAGLYYFYEWDWERAERESARTIELNPSYAEGHHLRGYILQTLNRTDEALQEQKRSMELDPYARPWLMVRALIHARQFDAALKDARKRSEHDPDNASAHEVLSNAYWLKGMEQEASSELEQSLTLGGKKDAAARVHNAFQRGGFRAVLELQLNELKQSAKNRYVSPMDFAELYGCLHRKDETLRYLEASYRERSPQLVHIQSNPIFDFVHSEPRYQTIVKNMGLTPAY